MFEEAWLSWSTENSGIGAVLLVPEGVDAGIVAVGRNLVATPPPAEQALAGNYMAHAEMNAFASLSSYSAKGMHLYSRLEPCLMCGATAIFLNVESIHFAAQDEYYQPFDEGLWPHHPYIRDRHKDYQGTCQPSLVFSLEPYHAHHSRQRSGRIGTQETASACEPGCLPV